MKEFDTLSLESRFTMDELRHERECLMTKRLELIEKNRSLSRRILIKPFLKSAQVPSPPSSANTKSYDTQWIENIVTGVVYDAVREVDVSKPYREKTELYNVISMSYDDLIKKFVSKSIKQAIVMEFADTVWNEIIKKEVNRMIKQCIGDANIVETIASTIILMSISKANKFLNPNAGDVLKDEYEVTKNLMIELGLERNKYRTERMVHTLHLDTIKNDDNQITSIQSEHESTDPAFDGEHLSAPQMFDIQRLQKVYLPMGYEKYSNAEIKIWKNIKVNQVDVSLNNVVYALSISPSMKYLAVSFKNNLNLIKCDNNSIIFKSYLEHTHGDIYHLSWSDNEEQLLSTSTNGMVCSWIASKKIKQTYFNKNSKHETNTQPNVLEIQWSFNGLDLRVTDGIFAQVGSDNVIRHKPLQAYFAPLFLPWGYQPVFFVVCKNKEILRLSWSDGNRLLLPEDIPRYEEIKNTTQNGLKVDILKGHQFSISKIYFKDEYILYSIDEHCGIIEWEYSRDNYDAYGYVVPRKHLVIGNDIEYVRLVKGAFNMFNKKGLKTRQEELQAAKAAEKEFHGFGFGKKPYSSRVNDDSQLVEESYIKSGPLVTCYETMGVVLVRKTLGRSLYAMKSRIFRLKNCKPSKYLGMSISPCSSIIAYSFYFSKALYGEPYISILLLKTSDLTFLKNKLKIPLTSSLSNTLDKDEHAFSCCITPVHYLTQAVYIVIKMNNSLMIISTATSNILRTTLDIHEYSCDNKNHFQQKHVSSIHGSLRCCFWGSELLIYGANSKQCLSISLSEPEFKDAEDYDNYFQQLSRVAFLAQIVDPNKKRLLLQSDIYWGKHFINQIEKHENNYYFKTLLSSLVTLSIDSIERKTSHMAEE